MKQLEIAYITVEDGLVFSLPIPRYHYFLVSVGGLESPGRNLYSALGAGVHTERSLEEVSGSAGQAPVPIAVLAVGGAGSALAQPGEVAQRTEEAALLAEQQ